MFGSKIWNDEIDIKLEFLLKSQYWKKEELVRYQLERLKCLINIAYHNTKFYRNKYESANISPENITCLEDLNKVPIISKEEFLSHRNDIQILDHQKKLYFAETSGSTGEPLVFYRDKEWDAWMRASLYRGYSWYGVKPWDRNGFLWGYNFSLSKRIKVKILDALQNRFRLFSYDKKSMHKFLKKLENAAFISGYSSMIYELAKEINKENLENNFHIKMAMGASEKIFDSYQDEVQKAFGVRMINEYGAAEAGIIAFECPEGSMHVNMETNIVQEENNELIITNLTSNSFPVIRYKLGDYVEIDHQTKCKCGREHYIIKEILGRTGKVIYGVNEKYPSLTLYYVFKNLAINRKIILNSVAVQKQKGSIEIYIESKLDTTKKGYFMEEYRKYFKNDLHLTLRDGETYRRENKKKTDFISLIDT
jgi:phenylacetate-CoA ligase